MPSQVSRVWRRARRAGQGAGYDGEQASTVLEILVPRSMVRHISRISMQIIGPNKGINKAVAKGPIVMIIAVTFSISAPQRPDNIRPCTLCDASSSEFAYWCNLLKSLQYVQYQCSSKTTKPENRGTQRTTKFRRLGRNFRIKTLPFRPKGVEKSVVIFIPPRQALKAL